MNNTNCDNLNNIGHQIKQLRKAKGWTQQYLAELSGLDRTTVGSLERDDYSDIGIRKVQRVLRLLGRALAITSVGLPTLDDLQNINRMAAHPSDGKK